MFNFSIKTDTEYGELYINTEVVNGITKYAIFRKIASKTFWGFFQYKAEYEKIARFSIELFPRCSGICVLTDVHVNEECRNKGVASVLIVLAIQEMTETFNAGILLATVIEDSQMNKLLLKTGFTIKESFINPRTNHNIVLLSN